MRWRGSTAGLASVGVELEDRLSVPSAEGIDQDLVLAGAGSRSAALVVDLVLQSLALLLFAVIAGSLGASGVAVAAVGGFGVLFAYPIAFEAFHRGQTLGKALFGIAVTSLDGSPVRFLPAVVRNVVRVVDALPGTYTVGLVAVLATDRNQRVGDLAAGTLVVRRPRTGATTVPGSVAVAGAPSGTEAWDLSALTDDEVAMARSFLDRREALDAQHRAALAGSLALHLTAKVAGVPLDGSPEELVERIVAARTAR